MLPWCVLLSFLCCIFSVWLVVSSVSLGVGGVDLLAMAAVVALVSAALPAVSLVLLLVCSQLVLLSLCWPSLSIRGHGVFPSVPVQMLVVVYP